MKNLPESNHTAHELMELHAAALFTHDEQQRLHLVNEPWPGAAAAPRFFLGRTVEGTAVCRVRHDVPETVIEQLEELCADETEDAAAEAETGLDNFGPRPKHFEAYVRLLQGQRFTMGPCFLVPAAAEAVAGWAAAVRASGRLPLYSTAWDNRASQSVARKSGFLFYGANFTVT